MLLFTLALAVAAAPQSTVLLSSGTVTITRFTATTLAGSETSNCRIIYAWHGAFDAVIEADPPARVLEGDVLYLTPGVRYSLTADPRTTLAKPAELATFDIACAAAQTSATRALRIRTGEHVVHTIANGLGSAAVLLDSANLGHAGFALTRLNMREDAEVPRHVHQDADEVLLVLEGEAFMLVDGKATKLAAGEAVRIEKGSEHSAKVPRRFVALQVYTPAGPEQRFKGAPIEKR